MYGGVHDDPGSRKRFVEELAKQNTPPHFVAVEWEKSVFEWIVTWRPWVEEKLGSCWPFLTSEDRLELSLALAWEGDAIKECFPGTDPLWLEADSQAQRCDAEYAKRAAHGLLERICSPCDFTETEFFANVAPPPPPQSKKDLIDRVSEMAWANAYRDNNFARDKRWASAICDRVSDLHDGWIAVVVGWAHADPHGDNRRLYSLLVSRGFSVNPVRLGPVTKLQVNTNDPTSI